ncbi:MAG: hypothetical protein EP343_03465 [Deltaproteobacteria bacterium]|nr:MAG: hypothetical protein EP343_03465 [Deltaproteobacteria bacterium]
MRARLSMSMFLGIICTLVLIQACGPGSDQSSSDAGESKEVVTAQEPQAEPTSSTQQETTQGEEKASPAEEPQAQDGGAEAVPTPEASNQEQGTSVEENTPEQSPPTNPVTIDNLTQKIAEGICGALFRCCNKDSVNFYFSPYKNSPNLPEFSKKLPPEVPLDAQSCPALVKAMIDVVPFGDWIKASKEGLVTFQAAEAQTCLDALKNATCGTQIRAALFDSTCFGFSPPGGGDLQRKMFKRTTAPGGKCVVIRDGVGSGFFGSCNPKQGFCCYPDSSGDPSKCSYPKTGSKGVCKQAAAEGESCKSLPPIQVCATGLSCDSGTRQCVAPSNATLQQGDVCADKSYNLLGTCKDSWCDITGSKKCEPLKADNEKCLGSFECKSQSCNKDTCGASPICNAP